MRKPSAGQIALLVGAVIATGVALSQSTTELQTIQVTAYAYDTYSIPTALTWIDSGTPSPGGGPGQINSATPTAHTHCVANTFAQALRDGSSSTPSDPNNTSLALPMRTMNPIDMPYTSFTQGYGAVSSTGGVAIFPNLNAGLSAAIASANNYAWDNNATYTITDLVNTWAPASVNPDALSNTLQALGMTSTMASSTKLAYMTRGEMIELMAAFAWQEGFKPSGC